MKTYIVTIPIAGHAEIEVDATSEEEAIDKAMESELTNDHFIGWEAIRMFNEGNVCYCPMPWEAEAQEA